MSIAVFKAMNAAMWVEGQPLTEDHKKTLEDSLLTKQAGVIATLVAENSSVMASSGSTPVYLLGKNLVHRPIKFWLHRQ